MTYGINLTTLMSVLKNKAASEEQQFFNQSFAGRITAAKHDWTYLNYLPFVQVVENHAALIAACPSLFSLEFKTFLFNGIVLNAVDGNTVSTAETLLHSVFDMFSMAKPGPELAWVRFEHFCKLFKDVFPAKVDISQAISGFVRQAETPPYQTGQRQSGSYQNNACMDPARPPYPQPYPQPQFFPPPFAQCADMSPYPRDVYQQQPGPGFQQAPARQFHTDVLEREIYEIKQQMCQLADNVKELMVNANRAAAKEETYPAPEGVHVDAIMQAEFMYLLNRLVRMEKHVGETSTPNVFGHVIRQLIERVNGCFAPNQPSTEELNDAYDAVKW